MKFFDSIGVDEKTWDEARYETAHNVLSWVVFLERILCYRQILDVVHIIRETHCSVDLLGWWLKSPDVELKFGKGGPEWDVENRPEGLSVNFVSFINHFIINKIKVINHRWIIADFSDGENWGEVLLKYFVKENNAFTFEINQSLMFPKK